ncbi:porin [Vibrio brasiliensis]
MKKTLVALSVMAAATSAQAFEVYNQDGVTVGFHGDIEVVYMNTTTRSSFQQEIQDADFGFDVRYAMNDEVTIGGYWEFDGATGTNTDNVERGDTYIAFYTNSYGSIKFGELCTAIDDAGIGNDYQYGISSFLDNNASPCADEAIRYDFDNGAFYATLGYVQDKINSTDLGDNDDYFDAKLGYRVADFDFTVYYGDTSLEATKVDESIIGLEGRYNGIENLGLALAYYGVDKETAGVSQDSSNIALDVTYTMDKLTYAAGYSVADNDNKAKEIDQWYVNAGYAIAPNTKAYAELGGEDYADGTDTDVALAVGIKAEF